MRCILKYHADGRGVLARKYHHTCTCTCTCTCTQLLHCHRLALFSPVVSVLSLSLSWKLWDELEKLGQGKQKGSLCSPASCPNYKVWRIHKQLNSTKLPYSHFILHLGWKTGDSPSSNYKQIARNFQQICQHSNEDMYATHWWLFCASINTIWTIQPSPRLRCSH